MAHPDFERSVNPISTRGDKLCPTNYYWHTRIFRPSNGPAPYLLNFSFLESRTNSLIQILHNSKKNLHHIAKQSNHWGFYGKIRGILFYSITFHIKKLGRTNELFIPFSIFVLVDEVAKNKSRLRDFLYWCISFARQDRQDKNENKVKNKQNITEYFRFLQNVKRIMGWNAHLSVFSKLSQFWNLAFRNVPKN